MKGKAHRVGHDINTDYIIASKYRSLGLDFKEMAKHLFEDLDPQIVRRIHEGDFIVAGDISGTVNKIGLRSTRIKALQGEEIVVPNSKLGSAQIQNFRKLKERRISFSLGVAYETSSDKLKKIPGIIKKIIESKKSARFDRAHFTTYADSSLVFDIVYFVESPDYVKYLNINQAINMGIKEAFEKEGISMAYPTQTLYLKK